MSIGRRLIIVAATLLVATAGLAAPAHAAPADQWGFAFVNNPTVPLWTGLDPAFQATSLGTKADGGTLGPGLFRVRFDGLGSANRTAGIVHVTAMSPYGHYCVAVGWRSVARAEVVDVQCFAPGGLPDDSAFMVMWTLNVSLSPPGIPGAYASVHVAPAVGVLQMYNSTGSTVIVSPAGTGVYEILFLKVGTGSGQRTGNLQVTAVSPARDPRWCKVAAWDDKGRDIFARVYCFDATGTLADSDFTATYHRERPVVSAFMPPKYYGYVWTPASAPAGAPETNFNYVAGGFGLNTLSLYGSTTIIVTFPIMAIDERHAQVTAFGTNPNYCTLGKRPHASGSDLEVYVRCSDPSGTPVLDDSFVTATNRS